MPDWYLDKYGGTPKGKSVLKGKATASQLKASTGSGRHGIRASTITPDVIHSTPPAISITASAAQPPPSFTAEQWAASSAAFGSFPSSNRLHGKLEVVDWIINTGCSHHVTGNKSCLFNMLIQFLMSHRAPGWSNRGCY